MFEVFTAWLHYAGIPASFLFTEQQITESLNPLAVVIEAFSSFHCVHEKEIRNLHKKKEKESQWKSFSEKKHWWNCIIKEKTGGEATAVG